MRVTMCACLVVAMAAGGAGVARAQMPAGSQAPASTTTAPAPMPTPSLAAPAKTPAAPAQAPPSSTPIALTLADALARGVATSPRVGAARSRETAASATVTSTAALRLPTVTATAGYLRTNHVTPFGLPLPDGTFRVVFPDIPDNYQTRAEVDVPVYTSGRVGALVDAAKADAEAARASSQVTAQDLRLQIVDAYWTLVTARANVGVLEDALRRMDASVADIRSHLDTGLAAPNDLLTAQAARARQSVDLIQARNAAAVAEADLARLIGVDPGQPIDPVTPVDEATPGSEGIAAQPLDALVARARAGRGERTELHNRQASLEASGAAALAAARPTVAAYGAVEPARPNQLFVPRADEWQTSWNLGVNVSWPLWDGGKARADAAAATAQAAAAGQDLQDFDAGLAVEIRQRLLDLASDRAALDASADELAAATDALRVANARFDAGVATSTDVLNAEVALREAELERTRLSADLRVSEARLLRALGAL